MPVVCNSEEMTNGVCGMVVRCGGIKERCCGEATTPAEVLSAQAPEQTINTRHVIIFDILFDRLHIIEGVLVSFTTCAMSDRACRSADRHRSRGELLIRDKKCCDLEI